MGKSKELAAKLREIAHWFAYSDYINALHDAADMLEAQRAHIDELHRGIEALRDALKREAGTHDGAKGD